MSFSANRLKTLTDTQELLQRLSLTSLEAIGNYLPAGIFVISGNEQIIYANNRAIKIFGFNPCGLGLKEYALNMAKARNLENSPYLYEQLPLIKALLYGQTTHNQEIVIQKPDQSQITLSSNATPLIDKKGNTIGAIAVFEEITDRKVSESKIKEYEAKFRSIAESSIIDISVSRPNGIILFVNDAYAKTFGYRKDELIGFLAPNLYVEQNDRKKLSKILQEQGSVKNYEVKVKRKDGTPFWVATSIDYIDFGGEKAFIGTSIDISQRKKAEEALKESEQLYRTLFENTEEGFQLLKPLYDKDGKPSNLLVLKVNKAYERQTGLKTSDVLGKTVKEYLPSIEHYWITFYSNVAKTGKAMHTESFNRDTNRWYDLYAFPHSEGQVGVLFRDITERKKVEEALSRSEERYRELFESMTEGYELCELVLNDRAEAVDYIIHDVNPAYEKESGLKREQVIGKRVTDILPIVEPVWFKRYGEIVRSGKAAKFEEYNASIDRWFSVYAYPLPDKNWFGIIFSDITERKNLEKQLQEKERLAAIGATAGMVGHDIRNPLQAIISDLYLLKDDLMTVPECKTKEGIAESIDCIEKNVTYINKIVADLQDYAKQLIPQYSQVNLYELVIDLFRSITIPEDVSPSIEIDQSLRLNTDPTLFQRILTNLIINAMQAMPKGGQLNIRATAKNGQATVIVADTGVGIPEHVKPKLFTPMMTTKAKGQGLGLAVVKRLVEALKGTISFESQVGKGTRFIIELPI